jgi:hypothetical protein
LKTPSHFLDCIFPLGSPARVLLHLVGVAGHHNFVGAEAERIVPLIGGRGEDNHVRANHVARPNFLDWPAPTLYRCSSRAFSG